MSEATAAQPSLPLPGAAALERVVLRRFALFLAILVIVSFPDVLFGWRSFFTRDFANFGYPLAHHVQQSYRAGEMPLWNPYNLAGLPFLAQWNTLALYPPSLLYVLLPLPWSLNLFNLLHLYLGGLAMFGLARRWLDDGGAAAVAGVGYAFGGLMASSLMWPNNIAALGWLPLVLLTGERAACAGGRHGIPAVFVMTMQLLSGAPEIIGLTWAGLAALVLVAPETAAIPVARRLGRLALVFVAALALSAIQLLPFLELLFRSQRDPAFAGNEWTLAWTGLGNLVVPLFHTFQSRDGIYFQPNQQWITSFYPGITTVWLAGFALWSGRTRRVRWLFFLAVLSVVLALGSRGFVHDWLRQALPGLGIMRYPIKFIVPVVVILPLLAGYGARAWFRNQIKSSAAAWFTGALASVAVGLLLLSLWRPLTGEQVDITWRSGGLALGFLGAAWGALVWCRRSTSPDSRRLAPLAIVLAIYADVFLANRHVNPVVHPEMLTGTVANLDPRPTPGAARVLVTAAAQEQLDSVVFTSPEAAVQIPRRALLLNNNLIERIPKLDGFFSLYPPGIARLVTRLARAPDPANDALLDFLGVSHVSRADQPWEWTARTNWLPLVNLVPHPAIPESSHGWTSLFSNSFDPRREVVLPPDAETDTGTNGAGIGRILSSRVKAHRIEATVEAGQPMWLTLAQANYPGWQARVDGRRVPLWTANYAFQAVNVPSGRHDVQVAFRPRSFWIGGAVTGLTLTVLLVPGLRWPGEAPATPGLSPR